MNQKILGKDISIFINFSLNKFIKIPLNLVNKESNSEMSDNTEMSHKIYLRVYRPRDTTRDTTRDTIPDTTRDTTKKILAERY